MEASPISIGLLCTIIGIVIRLATYNLNRDKDVRDDASESAIIRTKLDAINQGAESIRIDIKANEMRVNHYQSVSLEWKS